MNFRLSVHSKLDLRNNNLTSISSIQKGLNAFRPSQLSKDDIFVFSERSKTIYVKNLVYFVRKGYFSGPKNLFEMKNKY